MKKIISTNTDIETYLKKQKKRLLNIYSCADTSSIISVMRNDIHEYIGEHPTCTYEELDAHMKMSDFYAKWIIDTEPTEVINKINYHSFLKTRGWLFILVSLCIGLSLITALGIEKHIAQTAIDNVQYVDINEMEEK